MRQSETCDFDSFSVKFSTYRCVLSQYCTFICSVLLFVHIKELCKLLLDSLISVSLGMGQIEKELEIRIANP